MKDKKSAKKTAPVPGLALVEGKESAGHDQRPKAEQAVESTPPLVAPGKKGGQKKATAKSEKPAKSQPDKVAEPGLAPVAESGHPGKKAGHKKPSVKPEKHGKALPADKAAKEEKKPLNFKVSSDFRREFKTFASAHDMKLSKLLVLAFESFRKQQGG